MRIEQLLFSIDAKPENYQKGILGLGGLLAGSVWDILTQQGLLP